MNKPDESKLGDRSQSATGSIRSNLAMLVFGLMTLLYLVAIDHEEWFHLRPISGVAIALSQASDDGSSGEGAVRR
jgi:hypothetical protein